MRKRPKIRELNCLLEKGQDFQITAKEYEEITGAPLPKNDYYVKNYSALARWASNSGYEIQSIQAVPVIERTVYITKKA